jgi:cytoskeletal protein CcmA (bactofilin family)
LFDHGGASWPEDARAPTPAKTIAKPAPSGFASPSRRAMGLFVTKNGQTFGPHEPEEIAIFLGTGDFLPEDFCWQEGWAEWRTISSVLPDRPAPADPLALNAPPVSSPPPPRHQGQIPDDIVIVGTLKLPDERTVTCLVEGEIHSPSTVTIARGTRVKAHIKAESVVVFGTVEGEIQARGRAVLKSSATLHGDIHAARVLVEEGATFNGKSHVNAKRASGAETKPASGRKKSTTPPSSAADAKSPARPA